MRGFEHAELGQELDERLMPIDLRVTGPRISNGCDKDNHGNDRPGILLVSGAILRMSNNLVNAGTGRK
jgi:hypothetical protein